MPANHSRAAQRSLPRRSVPPRAAGTGARRVASGEGKTGRGEKRRLAQLLISAVILLSAVVCKVTMPTVTEQYRQDVLRLLGQDADFTAAFAAVGQAVAPGGQVGEALNDAYMAVFGAQKDERILSVVEPLPEQTEPLQQILGFAYAPPLDGDLTDRFGYRTDPISGETAFHYGVDLAADEGTPIRAFANGTVTVVAESAELGKYVMVEHPNGVISLYAHCVATGVKPGQTVTLGEEIAQVGQTGRATGPHLHFELHRQDVYLNPVYYVSH